MNNKLNPNNLINIDSSNVTQQTINLNDFLVRLSTQEKLKNSNVEINKNSKQVSQINQSEISANKTGTLTQITGNEKNLLNNQQFIKNLPEKVSIPTPYAASNIKEPDLILTVPKKTTINRNDSQNSTLKRFAAVAPPESKQLVMQPTNEVITLDYEDQFNTDHYNSIIRPREKKIEKPKDILYMPTTSQPVQSIKFPEKKEVTPLIKKFKEIEESTNGVTSTITNNNKDDSIYMNNLPVPAPRRSTKLNDSERVKRLNSFFGEKKDSVTELESKIFNELIMNEEKNSILSHQHITPSKSLPIDDDSKETEAEKLKKSVMSNLTNLNKNINRSCENILATIANNDTVSNIPSWKKKILKKMKRHLKGDKAPPTEVNILPIDQYLMSSKKKNLPFIVEFCTEEIEKRGLKMQGVYRLACKHSIVNHMLKQLQKNIAFVDWSRIEWSDVSCLGGLLKLFFRKLPEPLITQNLYESFLKAAEKDSKDKVIYIRELVAKLPLVNYQTLEHLAQHLNLIASHASENNMDSHNLATLFGPSLVHSKYKATKELLAEMSAQIDIIENIINYNQWIFSKRPVEELKLMPTNKEVGLQLLPNAETLLELIADDGDEEDDENNDDDNTFSLIKQNISKGLKISRLFGSTDQLGFSKRNTGEKLSLRGSFKSYIH